MEIKDFYNEVGINYRYFLSWRHKLLAGYLASVAGLAIGFSWVFTHSGVKPYSWAVFILGLFISLVFWGLDYRNRDLYHACQKSGAEIELKQNMSSGIYTLLNEKTKKKITHSIMLDIMFSLSSLGFLVGALIIICKVYCSC
jgi:hypothetical protein